MNTIDLAEILIRMALAAKEEAELYSLTNSNDLYMRNAFLSLAKILVAGGQHATKIAKENRS
ncbi:MAG TPA: hypothetical protein VFK30_00665 [Anaerolineae bacterium]|nr:hypothetical protein [Anaerolineae bacterium]